MEELLTNLFSLYKDCRTSDTESFGDFCFRAGQVELKTYIDALMAEESSKAEECKAKIKSIPMPEAKWAKDFIGGIPDVTHSKA
jgi:hypothetical protein